VRRKVAEQLDPIYLSRFGVAMEGHEASLGDPAAARLAPGARRFDVGNFNFPAALAVAPSMQMLLDAGPENVQRTVFALAATFPNRMLDIGMPVFGGRPGPSSSHIVTVGGSLGYDHDAASDQEMAALHERLKAAGVRLSVRRNLLRFSFHLYNNMADVEQVTALCAEWLRERNAHPRGLNAAA